MKKTIVLNDGINSCCKSINKYIIENLKEECDIIFSKCHGKIFHIQQTHKPKLALWSASEYTQEFHDYISEYHSDITILLIVDIVVNNSQVVDFLNKTNVKIIQDSRCESGFQNIIAKYDNLYEDSVFVNTNENRNDKILAILSGEDSANEKLKAFLYPNNQNKKIVAVGNPRFDSLVNLGIFNSPDLAFILNRFQSVLDLSGKYRLESQACNIPYLDVSDIGKSIEDNVVLPEIANLPELTYKNFVSNHLLQYIRSKI